MAEPRVEACIYVLAGTNGAGKSSIGGAAFRAAGTDYFNPDEAARRIASLDPALTREQANSAAWSQGKRLLERAIRERLSFAFETTLGGNTITRLLERALDAGLDVRVWYVGLEGAELHVARVKARAAAGGHDIPEATIRARYHKSRLNLIALLPRLRELRLYDNSPHADPAAGEAPEPLPVLHMESGRLVRTCELDRVATWAKPILAAALAGGTGRRRK